ncbi:helix-turn-helix domain-containing protein [Streptomyces virens]|uniref:Helix-turn-helix domain-containing protein n=2 Tax=Streptomyces TaxID=1883 RepID=A0A937EKM6_9ACTN|nr:MULTISPECIES: helix-turn-helix domain-containing protein [Streptomyces]MBA8975546.1 excisionase family DNA binding protein [Streptomyces calvus]MBL1084218.1 helix-turn-helix domain-containing protein [Streptomyces actinomycinicus]MYS27932.1 helix-turn-helix domain-containing protein [Streptomyces sp. SID7804]
MPSKQKLVTRVELAEYLGLPIATLAQWSYRGTGPRSIKVGRHVRYRWTDVERWLDEQSRGAAA